jgi:general secretion pathway protein D
VDATLQALSLQGDVRILSRPIIQVQNNQEARILVGSQVPFVQVSQVSDLGNVNEVVQYRDVGTSLTILPTINEAGYVNLLLTQEVSSVTDEIQFDAPVISTREATTQILARSGQTVVIGGLVERQTATVRSGIPILMDIPLLGFLFSSTREVARNSELFLFLTAFVVATDEDAELLRLEIEGNAELLESLVPIPSILPQGVPVVVPDTIGG